MLKESQNELGVIHRDEDLYASLRLLLDSMLKSKKVKYQRFVIGMGATVPSLTTLTDYGQEGPSLVNGWKFLWVTHGGPKVETTQEERDEITALMEAHGSVDFKLDHNKMYELL